MGQSTGDRRTGADVACTRPRERDVTSLRDTVVRRLPGVGGALSARRNRHFEGSQEYWERRYAGGGTSGAGSAGRLAAFKAQFLNDFVRAHDVTSVVEFGCGDGNQLALAAYPRYLGLDVSPASLAGVPPTLRRRLHEELRAERTRHLRRPGALPRGRPRDLARRGVPPGGAGRVRCISPLALHRSGALRDRVFL